MVINSVVVEKVVQKHYSVTESCRLRGHIFLLINYFLFFFPIIHGKTIIF